MDYSPPGFFLCPWDFPGKNTRVGCHFLLQGIVLTQGSNPCLLYWQADSLLWNHQASPLLTYFCFSCPCFQCQIKKKKSLSRPTSVSLPSMLSSKNFMVSGFESDLMLWPYIQVLNPFRVYICVWCKIGVQFHYFACLSGTIFWKDCPSPLSILHSFVV